MKISGDFRVAAGTAAAAGTVDAPSASAAARSSSENQADVEESSVSIYMAKYGRELCLVCGRVYQLRGCQTCF
jgi:hypothetical protein